MRVSKHIVSSIAAVSVMGVIGYAYAQTTTDNSTGPITVPPVQSQTTPPMPSTTTTVTTPLPGTTAVEATTTTTTPAQPMTESTTTTTVNTPSDAAGMSNERPAQTDRN